MHMFISLKKRGQKQATQQIVLTHTTHTHTKTQNKQQKQFKGTTTCKGIPTYNGVDEGRLSYGAGNPIFRILEIGPFSDFG